MDVCMKYDKLTIEGLPKKFKVYYALDYLYPDAHLRPAPTLDIQAKELRQMFADMQWEKE